MDKITIKDKQFVKYISSEIIQKSVKEVANRINTDYYGKTPVLIVVLNGAIMFASDLLKNLTINCEVCCVKVSSYEGMVSSSDVKTIIGLKTDIKGRDVIIVEDIVDTGNTVDALSKMLVSESIASVKIATMTFKPEAYKRNYAIDYVALSIPNKFIVGYGLDYNELGRNYKDIYQVLE
jgi:hypoxanthine phosphoribosyltransferase